MSLHTASKYLASKGRRGDTELVHMTKGEIRGLQQLALAHGGSLTINPETGLVEAGILKSVLPMVAGAALTVATGGTALAAYAPMMAALAAGGGMYAATGSLKEGLIAGLGAYGGASLAGGIMEAGAQTAAEQTVEQGLAESSKQAGLEASTSAVADTSGAAAGTGVKEAGLYSADEATRKAAIIEAAKQESAQLAAQQGGAGATGNVPLAQQGPEGLTRAQAIMKEAYTAPGGTSYGYQAGQNLENLGRGLPQTGNVIMSSPKAAFAAASPFFFGATDSGVQGFPPNQDDGGGATLSSDFQGFVPSQPNPYYQAQYGEYRRKPQAGGVGGLPGLASGGIAALAGGGTDPMNPIQNPVYPQSQQDNTQFATSSQYPNSMKSAMAADYDTRTNPMTGQELPMGLAEGGVARYGLGGIGMVRSIQPGGAWGDMTAQAYGAVQEQKPQWLQNIEPGGFIGATAPGKMDYEEGKRREEEAKADEENRRKEMAKQQAELQRWQNFKTNQAPQQGLGAISALAAGGTTKQHLPSSPSMPSGGVYRDTDADTASKDAYQAALIRLQKANKLAGLKAVPMPKANMEKLGGVDFDVDEKAGGGIAHYNLGGYSDGGRMLKGPGDGMSDSIPASIGGKQAARLADGEFVVPADVVSHLGNGSTDAGAKKLYGMMDKVRHARTGTKKQGKQIKADKYLPK